LVGKLQALGELICLQLFLFDGLAKRNVAAWPPPSHSLSVAGGRVRVCLRRSGFGKSTLLGLLMGIAPYGSGSIHLAGGHAGDRPPEAGGVAIVLLSHALFAHTSVRRCFGRSVPAMRGQ
jgi:ABC-type Fe3+/spermidine/putrescine transport system ATPase subunit